MQGKSVIFSAPSGAGKTTLVRHVLSNSPHMAFSISVTSRPIRKGEEEGIDYYFVTPEEFQNLISRGELLEWEEVYPGRYYGTLKKEVERLWQEGKTVIFDVDVEGGVHLKELLGDACIALFVEPPSLQVLEERLRKRGTEDEDSLRKRLGKARDEMGYANRFDAIIVNVNLEDAKKEALQRVVNFLTR